MSISLGVLATFMLFAVLAYHRTSRWIAFLSFALLISLATYLNDLSVGVVASWLLLVLVFAPLLVPMIRIRFISQPLFKFYKKIAPSMSRTEEEAIAAGTVSWEGQLFRGAPDWQHLQSMPASRLTPEEQAFIDGPVETLCRMIDDWDITHNRADLPPEIWRFIKEQGFFGLIIPKQYGGKAFSAFAHSEILVKVSGLSVTVSTTIAVPNSLGPAELLLDYGTDQQKNHYLPRLAKGEEIPCFALTSPTAGSDAGAMTDNGIVCWGEHEGEKVLGIRTNWDKRYITLAPVATVIGLAFKLYDPDHLLGDVEDIGITCALVPRETPGVTIGRRHFPLDTPFQNGPIQGEDVFIPMDWVIGGQDKVGKGWGMLMECLAAGRAITLPSSAVGGAKVLSYTTGAYARIRKQFNTSIGYFEGVQEALARIAAYTYIMDSARIFATSAVDQGEKPAVASAIVKYHVTELGRMIACDGMDIHGGKGICLGPNNYIGRGYESAPIAITVEGANILTRSMIIFGQGAIRCHPYVLAEIQAAREKDPALAVKAFDKAVMGHIGYGISNIVRTFVLALTGGRIVRHSDAKLKRYYQRATRFSSALALFSDVSMLVLGGSLKRRESLSARLGDILSYLYLLSAVLKRYQDEGRHAEDLPLVRYSSEYCLFQIQQRFCELIQNFPNRPIAWVMNVLIFPFGRRSLTPKDKFTHKIARLILSPTDTRQRLSRGAFLTPCAENTLASVQNALLKVIDAEPIEKIIRQAKKDGVIQGYTFSDLVQSALDKGVITRPQLDTVMQAEAASAKVIAVDDFSNEELAGQFKEESLHSGSANDSSIYRDGNNLW